MTRDPISQYCSYFVPTAFAICQLTGVGREPSVAQGHHFLGRHFTPAPRVCFAPNTAVKPAWVVSQLVV